MKKSAFLQTLTLFCIVVALVASCKNQQKEGPPRAIINPDSVKNHIIDIKLAREYTKSFREGRSRLDTITQGKFVGTEFSLANAESLNRDVFALLLEQKDKEGNPAAGIRMY